MKGAFRLQGTKSGSVLWRNGRVSARASAERPASTEVSVSRENQERPVVLQIGEPATSKSKTSNESFFDTLLEVVESKWGSNPTAGLRALEQRAVETGRLLSMEGIPKTVPKQIRIEDLVKTNDVFLAEDHEIPENPEEVKLMMEQIKREQRGKDDAIESFTRFALQEGQRVGVWRIFKDLVAEWMPSVTRKIEAMCETTSEDPVYSYLGMIEPETAASVAIHHVLCATITGDKPLSTVARTAGVQLMEELSFRVLKGAMPQLKKKMKAEGSGQESGIVDLVGRADNLVKDVQSSIRKNQRVKQKLRYNLLQLAKSISNDIDQSSLIYKLGACTVSAVLDGCRVCIDPADGTVKPLGADSRSERVHKHAFLHDLEQKSAGFDSANSNKKHRVGILRLNEALVDKLHRDLRLSALKLVPRHGPMIVKPRDWEGPHNGGYLITSTSLMRTKRFQLQRSLLETADLKRVTAGLNALGRTKWVINKPIFDIAEKLWNRGGGVAGLVSRSSETVVPRETFLKRAETEGLDEESKIKLYRRELGEVYKTNSELHSERCSTWYKFEAAREFKDGQILYFPHNLDFRGRAYPLSTQLHHTGDDLSRGVLTFAGPGEEIGAEGLKWLKVHFANLLGGDKLPMADRIEFAEENLLKGFRVAGDPLADDNIEFWAEQDDPFQCLAVTMELERLLRSGVQTALKSTSSLPVHQDGSCNGLQHYAALGRDEEGGAAVNLLPSDKPADVYTAVLEIVKKRMEADIKDGNEVAEKLLPHITRKVVKQTVMTSVYGVTGYGARLQVLDKLDNIKGIDKFLASRGASYVASLTLESLADLFTHAKETMTWLADSADAIAATGQAVHWISPLGLPCIQPYHTDNRARVNTLLQNITYQRDSTEADKVNRKRQRAAFAPNYIHSLDSSHMLMSAQRCYDQGLPFASVHDSYWTIPARVPIMNRTLRQAFIDLHSRNLLDELLEHFRLCYPGVHFEKTPQRGELDLTRVAESPYFFD